MKKTYIAPETLTASFKAGVLMEGSMDVNPGGSTSGSSGGWTRKLWASEEDED